MLFRGKQAFQGTISKFTYEYYFLSNFYMVDVWFAGIKFRNSEAAFQAMKCINPKDRIRFANLYPSEAKKLGRSIELRPDWEQVKEELMFKICYAKFSQNSTLRDKLIETHPKYLEEGNDWNDRYWGVSNGAGLNKLGWILMKLREHYILEYKTNDLDAFAEVYMGEEYCNV